MRVYISGAITGTNDYPLRFASAEQRLHFVGHDVINPAKTCCTLPELNHGEYMKVCLTLLKLCDAVFLLPHSEESAGVKIELEYADKHKIPVITL